MATTESTGRVCRGCDVNIVCGERERNPRVWCSESCRIGAYRAANDAYRARSKEQNRLRSRETYVPTSHDLKCVVCGVEFAARWKSRKFCSESCRFRNTRRARSGRMRAGLRSPYSYEQVVMKSAGRCALCAGRVDLALRYPDPGSGSVDHVVPLSLGGSDAVDNVQLAHLRCNLRKGARV